MSQFWLADDNDDQLLIPLSYQSQGDSNNAFSCENCGSTDCYYDSTAGRDVCNGCFTQSQQINSASQDDCMMDYDEVMGLAAKSRGNLVMSRKRRRKGSANMAGKRLPLEDQSVPFPDLETCLEGLACTLKSCAKKMARNLLNLPTDFEKSLVSAVGKLWISYLQAYADGADRYGALYPELRFSLRDAFICQPTSKNMIISHLVWKAVQKLDDGQGTEPKSEEKGESSSRVDVKHEMFVERQGPINVATFSRQPQVPSDSKCEASLAQDTLQEITSGQKEQRVKFRPKSMDRVLFGTNSTSRLGYKEAALKLKPSMDFCATLLWLAVCKSGVTKFEFCRWIADGKIPLLNAFDNILSSSLQRKLRPIRSFFKTFAAPSPSYLEASATVLAVACRMKASDTFAPKTELLDELCFWSPLCLPFVVAKLVANAGLDQMVLDRTLALMNLSTPVGDLVLEDRIPKPLDKISAAEIRREDDILAVIAIACMMDPTWRSWSYQKPECPPMPNNECHFRMLTCDPSSLKRYLDFVEANVLDKNTNMLWNGFFDQQSSDISETSGYYSNSDESDVSMTTDGTVVKRCAKLLAPSVRLDQMRRTQPQTLRSRQAVASMEWIGLPCEDRGRTILIDYLAYSAQAQASRIRQKVQLFLAGIDIP
jgi:hypothetical protein